MRLSLRSCCGLAASAGVGSLLLPPEEARYHR